LRIANWSMCARVIKRVRAMCRSAEPNGWVESGLLALDRPIRGNSSLAK
jgi:hypothetical protein